MPSFELTDPVRRHRGLLIAAFTVFLIPTLHPLLRPAVGVPSHLLWFAHTLPVALVVYGFGLRGAIVAILASVVGVAWGERLFGAGYGTSADEATILALSTAVGLTNALVAGFALVVRAERARRRDLAQLVAAALSASPEAVLLLDEHYHVQYANDAARRLFGTRPGQLAGSPFERLLAEERASRTKQLLMEGGRPVPVVARTIGGRPFAAEMSASPVRDGRRHPIACLVTVRDQSERLRREQTDRRTQSLSELGASIASVAHELNNPLAAVTAYAELLREAPGADSQLAEDLQTIAREAHRAAQISRQLLSVVRRGERPRERVDLNRVIEQTLKGRATSFAAHGIQVAFTAGAALQSLTVVRAEIEQVLVNLLANAEQAMYAARGSGELRITTRNAGRVVEVTVADDGPGISPEHLPRLFEAFFTTKPVGSGTGLGLSIARRIMRDHGGDLTVESVPGQGATFTLRLPAVAGHPVAEEPLAVAPRSPAAVDQRVLVVDDEPALRRSVERLLRRHGIAAVAAADADAALRHIDFAPFDLVLCDVHLGEASGIELYRAAVRRHPGLRDRFVFMTGDVLSLELREFFAASGLRHLTKPFELDDLLGAVQPVAAES